MCLCTKLFHTPTSVCIKIQQIHKCQCRLGEGYGGNNSIQAFKYKCWQLDMICSRLTPTQPHRRTAAAKRLSVCLLARCDRPHFSLLFNRCSCQCFFLLAFGELIKICCIFQRCSKYMCLPKCTSNARWCVLTCSDILCQLI